MASLAKNHITDLFCLVDELLPKENKNIGRSLVLSDTEIVTILIWHSLIQGDKTLKEIFENLNTYHLDDFPKLGSYKSFVRRSH